MKHTLAALAAPSLTALAVLCTSLPVHADIAYNIGAFTDYRFRGISQTRLKPAVQGGLDFSQGGFYLGAWASNIKWIKDAGGDASIEIDVYGGYKGALTKDVGYDVGVLTYQYPKTSVANTTEIYGALTFGPATLKYSHAVTDTFGNTDSKNSYYLDLSASFELADGWTLAPHVGRQRITGPLKAPASYVDYSLTLSKDFKGIVPSIALVGTSRIDKAFYTSGPGNKELGKTGIVLGVKYNF